MAEVVRVVVDAMGGDYAPVEPVKAACPGKCILLQNPNGVVGKDRPDRR